VAQEQPNLLSTRRPAQLRAGPAEIMGRDAGNADFRSVLPEHLPYDFLAQALARQSVSAVHAAEYVAVISQGSRGGPSIHRHF
jgi:hypothetical protein